MECPLVALWNYLYSFKYDTASIGAVLVYMAMQIHICVVEKQVKISIFIVPVWQTIAIHDSYHAET